MKNRFNLLYMLLVFACSLQAQVEPYPAPFPCDKELLAEFMSNGQMINLSLGSEAAQSSSIFQGGEARLATDGNLGSLDSHSSRTSIEENPWWEVDLGQKSIITELQVYYNQGLYPGGLRGSYILFSEQAFENGTLNTVLESEEVQHIFVETNLASGQSLRINPIHARYVRIQYEGIGSAGFNEVFIIGGPGPSNPENCSNGIDDDGDCKIDCEDSDCAPLIQNVYAVDPTCPICDDGSIRISAYSAYSAYNATLQYSIDGGDTFQECESPCLFEGLREGEYEIVVTNGICTTYYQSNPVLLGAPPGGAGGDCFNGGFEEGSFFGWTGGLGDWVNGSVQINNQDFDFGDRHSILQNGVATDPFIPGFNIGMGTYFAQLGNSNNGAEAERLQYCFVVDANNADFFFNYAVVLEDPGHAPNEQPYFSFTAVNNTTGAPITSETYVSDADDPFFISANNGSVAYRGWTCVNLDLTPHIGNEVCIEFIVADCEQGGHFGYAYLEGLCNEPLPPSAELVTPPDVYCLGQSVDVQAINEIRINRYQWCAARLDGSNQPFDPIEFPLSVGYNVPDLTDLLGKYEQEYPNYVFDCNDRFRITLKLFSDCAEGEISKDISFSCNAYDLNYPDILVCSGGQDVQITGTNTCNDCTVTWSIAEDPLGIGNSAGVYLNDINSPTPTILGTLNTYALSMVYRITVLTPEGCVYEDDVRVINMGHLDVDFGTDPTNICTFDSVSSVSYLFPVEFSDYFDIQYFIKGDYGQADENVAFEDIPEEEFDITWITDPNSSLGSHQFIPDDIRRLLRGIKQELKVCITPILNNPDVVVVNPNCKKTFTHLRDSDSPYFGDINIFVPNIFNPNSQNPENAVIRPFFSSNVYEAWFKVFDRWGELVHEASVEAQNNQALTEADLNSIAWDGVFNGQQMDPQVFTFVVDYQNCQVAPADCFDASSSDIIGPNMDANEPNQSNLSFRDMIRGTKINANTSLTGPNGGVINCGFTQSPPVNLIKNIGHCSNATECNDFGHAGDVTLIN